MPRFNIKERLLCPLITIIYETSILGREPTLARWTDHALADCNRMSRPAKSYPPHNQIIKGAFECRMNHGYFLAHMGTLGLQWCPWRSAPGWVIKARDEMRDQLEGAAERAYKLAPSHRRSRRHRLFTTLTLAPNQYYPLNTHGEV